MNLHRLRNRLREWRLALLTVSACLVSVKWMELRASDLDRLCDEREQALQDLFVVQDHLRDHRGRYTAESTTLGSMLRNTLSEGSVRDLFPGVHPRTRTTHAGLLLHLKPIEDDGS